MPASRISRAPSARSWTRSTVGATASWSRSRGSRSDGPYHAALSGAHGERTLRTGNRPPRTTSNPRPFSAGPRLLSLSPGLGALAVHNEDPLRRRESLPCPRASVHRPTDTSPLRRDRRPCARRDAPRARTVFRAQGTVAFAHGRVSPAHVSQTATQGRSPRGKNDCPLRTSRRPRTKDGPRVRKTTVPCAETDVPAQGTTSPARRRRSVRNDDRHRENALDHEVSPACPVRRARAFVRRES